MTLSVRDRVRAAWRVLTGRVSRSAFHGAESSRLTYSWAQAPTHINRALYDDLTKLRARSRELARNNEYGRKFLALVADNVVGHSGFGMQVHALDQRGALDENDSTLCEQAFSDWARMGNCEVTGKLSFTALQRLVIRSIAQDGEALIRKHRVGKYGYQLEVIDPGLLDVRLQRDLASGNKIRMGIEYDSMHRPVAYYLLQQDYADPTQSEHMLSNQHQRVPAEEIFHLFVPEAVAQLRGVPWMSAAMYRLQMLGGYEEAAMVAARLGAAVGGFFETADGDITGMSDSSDEDNGAGNLQMDIEPGVFRALPPGVKLANIDPKYPHQMFADFVKIGLRGVSTGFGVAYNSLSNDLEGVNYSSIRAGVLEERETWKGIQGWFIEAFLARVYSEWLPGALISGYLRLPFYRISKFDAAVWQGRRWDWVDPDKDTSANVTAVQNGLKSYSQIIREQGRDPNEVWRELQADREKLKALGLRVDPQVSNGQAQAAA